MMPYVPRYPIYHIGTPLSHPTQPESNQPLLHMRHYLSSLGLLAAIAAFAQTPPNLCGSVVSTSGMESGVYQIPMSESGTFKLLGKTEKASGGGVLCDDIYYLTVLNNTTSY